MNQSESVVRSSVIDGVLSAQPELGPKIPDGGYGWVIFAATSFFQMFIPSLIVVYGVFLASSKVNTPNDEIEVLHLWNDKLTYVPLFFMLSWTIFDPTARNLISHSTWPRLIGQTGNCLTCAGLLFVWMGMAGNDNEASYISDKSWLKLAGIISGIGSSIQVSQCEILLAQYFKVKHLYLTHATHMIVALGFIISPILVSQLLLKFNLLQVVLIYQAILLQGVLISIAFKTPSYLKSKLVRYHYVMENGEDEEDIFSKSLTELKVKTKDEVKTIELKNDAIAEQASTSNKKNNNEEIDGIKKEWIKFNDEEQHSERKSWERFEEEKEEQNNNTETEAGEITVKKFVALNDLNNRPTPLFHDSRVNMNTTYSFDEDYMESGPKSIPTVFPETERTPIFDPIVYLRIIRMPTFYKSLLTVLTTKYSLFLFYVLFPTYLKVEISNMTMKRSALLIGLLSLVTFVFSGISYWLNVNKQKRPIFLFLLCWIGANGYFLIASYRNSEYVVIFGGLEIVLSIASLQHIGGPLLGLTIRGESNSEYVALSLMTGVSFLIFLAIDFSYRDCFFMMALLHMITGLVWVSNYFYKKLRIW